MDGMNPQLMALMKKGGNPPAASPNAQGPVSSPMSTPQPNEGEKQAAMSQVQMAIDLFEQTLPAFGSETDEGKTILEVLGKLSKTFGDKKDKARGLIPSEIMNLVSSMPKGAGGQPPMPAGGGMPQAGAASMPQPPMMQ